jgi:hypothetical protein
VRALLHGASRNTPAPPPHTAMKKLRIVILGFGRRDRKGSLNDGQIQNPSKAFGIVPLSNFVPRGFGLVHHSIAILYHEVPNPNITIRNFFIAVPQPAVSGANTTVELSPPEELRQCRRNDATEPCSC